MLFRDQPTSSQHPGMPTRAIPVSPVKASRVKEANNSSKVSYPVFIQQVRALYPSPHSPRLISGLPQFSRPHKLFPLSFSFFLPLPGIVLCLKIKTKILERPNDQPCQITWGAGEAATGAAALSVSQGQPTTIRFLWPWDYPLYVRTLSTALSYKQPGLLKYTHTHTQACVGTEPNPKTTQTGLTVGRVHRPGLLLWQAVFHLPIAAVG